MTYDGQMSSVALQSTGQAGRLIYPAHTSRWTRPPVMSEAAHSPRLVTANHTHTWWCNMSPLKEGQLQVGVRGHLPRGGLQVRLRTLGNRTWNLLEGSQTAFLDPHSGSGPFLWNLILNSSAVYRASGRLRRRSGQGV